MLSLLAVCYYHVLIVMLYYKAALDEVGKLGTLNIILKNLSTWLIKMHDEWHRSLIIEMNRIFFEQ